MLAQPITRALDLNYNGVMQKVVEQRGRDYGIAEHFAPFGKTSV